ncbi:MAG: S8 family serine peptidase [Elusimicrobiota bacterium]|nr:S8 family serine peptidase [Elusimicrobiota bacterium]
MKFPHSAAACLIFLLVLMPAGRAFALKIERFAHFSPASGKTSSLEVAAGSAIVRFKTGVSSAAATASLAAAGFTVDNYLESFGWAAVRLPAGMSVAGGVDLLKNIAAVESAEPNRVFRPSRTPNDPLLSSQYALAQVQAFGAWEYETGFSSRVTVAIIDTGIDGSHPELSVKLTGTSRAFDPVSGAASNNQPPTPACNHATRAAGVAAAASDNSAGVAGISWGAKLLSLKIFSDSDCNDDCSDSGSSCATSETSIAAAVNDAISLHNTAGAGKVIINMSLGDTGGCSGPLQTAVDAATAAGLMLFAASGNDGAPFIDSPANCAGVIAVGATDLQDNLASFSNRDTLMVTKGLTAPGVSLYTTTMGGGYASASGTSFSSPLAAGLAALVWSAKPAFTAVQVLDTMKNSADDLGSPGPDRDFGGGRINALKAMRLAVNGSVNFAGTNKAVAYPNPFRPKTQRLVSFTIPEDMTAPNVEVKVYTSEGELVKKLEVLAWDGKNAAGSAVASGVYLFRVRTDKDAAVGKFALIR